jgi:hypothetical protein
VKDLEMNAKDDDIDIDSEKRLPEIMLFIDF